MHADEDFDLVSDLPPHQGSLFQDLELNIVCNAMANGNEALLTVAKRALMQSLTDPGAIRYRQEVLEDSLRQRSVVRAIRDLAVETVKAEREVWGLSFAPSLRRSTQVMEIFVAALRRLRRIGVDNQAGFSSKGFLRFFAMLSDELTDDYLDSIERHLRAMRFRRGVFMSVDLASGNTGSNYVLRQQSDRHWADWLPSRGHPSYSFEIDDRDDAGRQALDQLNARGVNLVFNALAQSVDHVRGFFARLASELAFYVGCVNLEEALNHKGEPICFPSPQAADRNDLQAHGLYDVALSLHIEGRVVGNDIDASNRRLVLITGANQGGKSTFLRALGQAQLMMQCGLFVGGKRFEADVRSAVFTHYKREEDASLQSGKFDEELKRVSEIVDHIRPHSQVLFNESFAATNEREGSEIARQVIQAMIESDQRVIMVTHMYDLTRAFERASDTVLFMRAERQDNGERTYKLRAEKPLPTSYGEDTYKAIFGRDGDQPIVVSDPDPVVS